MLTLAPQVNRLGVELHRLAILDDDDAVLAEPGLARHLRVLHELPVLAVHRDEVFRPHRVEHLAQLVALGVSGDVHVADLRIKHPRPVTVQVVDRLVDEALVARDRPGRDHDPVAL